MSDMHGKLPQVNVPDGDVLIVAGDSTMMGSIDEVKKLVEQLNALPHRHKILIAGNHDWLFFKKRRLAKKLIAPAIYLEDSEITIDGVRFYGSPWQPEFCNWAFNLPRGKALKEKWDLIPEGIDVLITHGPPWGYCDYLNGENLGCHDLSEAVYRKYPRYHVFGHIHDGHGVELSTNLKTTFINASICDERYRPVNEPIVFEIEPK